MSTTIATSSPRIKEDSRDCPKTRPLVACASLLLSTLPTTGNADVFEWVKTEKAVASQPNIEQVAGMVDHLDKELQESGVVTVKGADVSSNRMTSHRTIKRIMQGEATKFRLILSSLQRRSDAAGSLAGAVTIGAAVQPRGRRGQRRGTRRVGLGYRDSGQSGCKPHPRNSRRLPKCCRAFRP